MGILEANHQTLHLLHYVTITVMRKCKGEGLKKARKHYTLRVLYYAMVTAQSWEHFPLPSIL